MSNFDETKIINVAIKLQQGDRRALSRAITLSESTRADHRKQTRILLSNLKKRVKKSIRIGLTGTPGVGKSTFIESIGLMLVNQGKKVAVLAIDPSSTAGGSILGDKTRMELLSRETNAFIRPSPTNGTLGGVTRRTREVISLCEAAGYDIIIVETVGVGQSETAVSEITDVFCLLIAPTAGDELQGVKRGIMEVSDLILVNKADGELSNLANSTRADYQSAVRLFKRRDCDPPNFPKVIKISSLKNLGLEKAWRQIENLVEWRLANGFFLKIRNEQMIASFKREINNYFEQSLSMSVKTMKEIEQLKYQIMAGSISPELAAQLLVQKIFDKD